jgi:hypothetical protein
MSSNKPTPLKQTIEEMQDALMDQQRGRAATAAHVSPFAKGRELAYRVPTAADLERIRRQQQHQPRAHSPPRTTGMISATLAKERAYQNYIRYYRNLEEQYRAVPGNERSYLDAMEEQQRREEERREQQWREQQQQQRREKEHRPRSRSPSSDNKKEAFAILGIPPTSSKTEIKKAYHKQALLLHPDKHRDNIEEATRRFQELQAAMDEINKEPHRGGMRRYRLYRKLKTRSHRHSHHRSRYTSRHHKRLRKSSKKYRR